MKPVTGTEIRNLINENREDVDTPTRVLDTLAPYTRSLLGKRQLKHLEEQFPHLLFCLRRQYGMTHLEWGPATRVPNRDDWRQVSLLIDWKEKNVLLPDKETLIERNPAYFRGAMAHNDKRNQRSLQDCENLAAAINTYNEARELLQRAIGGGSYTWPDAYEIREKFVADKGEGL